jgi:hypothetical protein
MARYVSQRRRWLYRNETLKETDSILSWTRTFRPQICMSQQIQTANSNAIVEENREEIRVKVAGRPSSIPCQLALRFYLSDEGCPSTFGTATIYLGGGGTSVLSIHGRQEPT